MPLLSRVDTAFKAVIAGCAAPQAGRTETWINKRIRDLYVGLYELGYCHSVEVWSGDDLIGGLYGVNLGRAFFGESMFHTPRDASKVALVHLVARLDRRRLRAARHPIRHRTPAQLRRGGSARAVVIARCSTRHSPESPPIFTRCRPTVPSAALQRCRSSPIAAEIALISQRKTGELKALPSVLHVD